MNSLMKTSALVRAATATNNNHAIHPPRATILCIQELIASNLQTALSLRKFANGCLAIDQTPGRGYVAGGVRPSSGAETLEKDDACEISETLERAEFAAAEDGQCH